MYDPTAQHAPSAHASSQPSTPIHAPIPISAYSTLLAHVQHAAQVASTPPQQPQLQPCSPAQLQVQPSQHANPHVNENSPPPVSEDRRRNCLTLGHIEDDGPQDTLKQYDIPQIMFPTPSELLSDIARKELDASVTPRPSIREPILEPPTVPTTPAPQSLVLPTLEEPRIVAKLKQRAKIPTVLQPAQPGRHENLRKSYFRSVADQVGFQPTDP